MEHKDCGGPILAMPALVSRLGSLLREKPVLVYQKQNPLQMPVDPNMEHQMRKNITTTYLQNKWCRLRNRGLSQHAASELCSSWRAGTVKLYSVYIRKWKVYARKRGIDPVHTAVTVAVNFLGPLSTAGQC